MKTRNERLKWLEIAEKKNLELYPAKSSRNVKIAELDKNNKQEYQDIAGRLSDLNFKDNIINGVLSDQSGSCPIILDYNIIDFPLPIECLDNGDILDLHGIYSNEDDKNIFTVTSFCFLAKSLRSVNTDTPSLDRLRQHTEIGLLYESKRRELFEKRVFSIRKIREKLWQDGFMEVETPIIIPVRHIAPVPPFQVTTSTGNSYDLRISGGDFVKRIMLSGYENLFQIGKFFRDESPTYNSSPEFMMLSMAFSYESYFKIMEYIEGIVFMLATEVYKKTKFKFNGRIVDITPPWPKISLKDLAMEFANINLDSCQDKNSLLDALKNKGLNPNPNRTYTQIFDDLFDEFILPNIINPTYIKDFPYYLGGPAKPLEEDSRYKERAELFFGGGIELANISSGLNNPTQLRAWHEFAIRQKVEAGQDPHPLNEAYLSFIEHGFPPTGTGAIGIDRLIMLLSEVDDMRDIMLFPFS